MSNLKVTITEPKSWQRILKIEIPADAVNDQIDSAYKRYQQQAVLPGFRKGKVPLSLIKARYSDTVEQSVLQEMIPRAWTEVQQQHKLEPIAEPVVSDVEFKPGQPLKFKASVEVKPEITLIDYSGLTATKKQVAVSPADVERNLKALQERHATISPAKGNAGEMDIVIIDSWKVDQNGVPIVGQNATDIPIDLSAPNVIKEYRQALVGTAVGDQKRVAVTYPLEHPQKELAGQEISFLLKVKEIKNRKLPSLDDDFAKAISDFPNLKALKEAIYQKLLEQEERRAQQEVEEQIIDQIIEKHPFEVPESMVAGYIESLIADLHPNEKKEKDLEQLRRSYNPLAVRAIKRWFILEEVGEKESLQVSEEDLKTKLTAMTKGQDISPEKAHQHLAQSGQLEKLRNNMKDEKILSFLVGKAQVKIETAKPKEKTP